MKDPGGLKERKEVVTVKDTSGHSNLTRGYGLRQEQSYWGVSPRSSPRGRLVSQIISDTH